jgi:hypothetical protein
MADGLDRQDYENPPIVTVAVQVMLSWTNEEMLRVAEHFESAAKGVFVSVEPTVQQEITFATGAPDGVSQNFKTSPTGLKCTDDAGTVTFLEPAGLRSLHLGKYPGRDQVIKGILWWCDRINEACPNLLAVRVSTLIENHIEPPEHGLYRIEDYLVPEFEFTDPRINIFETFEHRLRIDLSEVAGKAMTGIVIIRKPADPDNGKFGIGLVIDVMELSQTALSDVRARVEEVKNVETHVFENVITKKTKDLYGPRNQ